MIADAQIMPALDLRLLGKRIQLLRVEHGWKQSDLAEKVGVSVPTISNLENAKMTSPDIDLLFRIAAVSGVSRPYILGLTNNPAGVVDPHSVNSDPVLVRLVIVYQDLPENLRSTLVEIAELLLSSV